MTDQRREQTRAREPDESGFIERDGVKVYWELHGSGSPTILLLPTWSIIHSRHWKAQIPYLARLYRVVTFDGRGNGRSDRPSRSAAYSGDEFAKDALAVLEATGTDQAVLVGFSLGSRYAVRLAAEYPERVLGAVLIGSAINVGGFSSDRPVIEFEADLEVDEGWARYNAHSWRRDWPGFVEWFFGQVFNEAHSTKHIEDALGWGLETDPETMIHKAHADEFDLPAQFGPAIEGELAAMPFVRRVRCPCLVIHGDSDVIWPADAGRRLAEELGAPLVIMQGSGHDPIARDPVMVNLLIRDFVRSLDAELAP